MFSRSLLILALVSFGARTATADVTSIFLAGFDAPQSMSISELGVGADGVTTFALSPGTPTDSEEDAPIPFTLTYVARPSAVSWFGDIGSEVCTLAPGGVMVCVKAGAQNGVTETDTLATGMTGFPAGFPVQIAPTVAGASGLAIGASAPSTPSATSATTPTTASTFPSSGVSQPAPTMTTIKTTAPASSGGTSPTGAGSATSPSPTNAGTKVGARRTLLSMLGATLICVMA